MDLTQEPASSALVAIGKAPSRAGMGITVGFLVAAIVYCVGQVLTKSTFAAIFCSPLFVGAIVGLLTVKHPIRNAFHVVLLVLVLATAKYHEAVVYALFTLPFVIPETILGALCGWTIRRYIRGRRARAVIGMPSF